MPEALVSPWLRLKEAAAYERRGARWLAREVKLGRVTAARIGGRGELLFRREWLDTHLESLATVVIINRRHTG